MGDFGQPGGKTEHALVHPVGFRVARQEIAPDAAAQERPVQIAAPGRFFAGQQGGIDAGGGHWQRPFVHFTVGRGGQIDDAARCLSGMKIGVGGGADFRAGQHTLDQRLQPATVVNPVVGFRPDAEFLDVVEINGRRLALIGEIFEMADDFMRRREGQAITQGFGNREKVEPGAVFFGAEVAIECCGGLAGTEEMVVVDGDVLDAGFGQRRHHGRLPDPLGEPRAAGFYPGPCGEFVVQRA